MDGRQPANVSARHDRVLAFDPAQGIRVLFIAVINRLVARTLGVHVDDCVDKPGLCETRGQGNGTEGRVCPRQLQCGGGITRTNHHEVLPAANPPGPEAVHQVIADLPLETGSKAVSPQIGVARIYRLPAPEVNLPRCRAIGIRSQVAVIQVVPEKLYLLGKVVVQAESYAVVL